VFLIVRVCLKFINLLFVMMMPLLSLNCSSLNSTEISLSGPKNSDNSSPGAVFFSSEVERNVLSMKTFMLPANRGNSDVFVEFALR